MSWGVALNQSSFKGLQKNMKAFGKDGATAMASAIDIATVYTHEDAVRASPVDTGRLRSSIHIIVNRIGKITGMVFTEVLYAIFVELGTNKQKAQPFLGPAFEKHVKLFPKYAEEAMANAIKANTK